MNAKKENPKVNKVEEPSTVYEVSKTKEEIVSKPAFDFDEEMKNGYTPEQFKAEMHKRIKAYPWKK
jgi:hypothetical protein